MSSRPQQRPSPNQGSGGASSAELGVLAGLRVRNWWPRRLPEDHKKWAGRDAARTVKRQGGGWAGCRLAPLVLVLAVGAKPHGAPPPLPLPASVCLHIAQRRIVRAQGGGSGRGERITRGTEERQGGQRGSGAAARGGVARRGRVQHFAGAAPAGRQGGRRRGAGVIREAGTGGEERGGGRGGPTWRTRPPAWCASSGRGRG